MRKRLFAVVAALALACSLAPGVAFSDEGGTSNSLVAVTIEIGADGAPSAAAGEGWSYDADRSILTLDAGHTFTFTGSACSPRVDNYGVIVDGTISGSISNFENATITGGTFGSYVYNFGIVSGGVFGGNGYVDNRATIFGGEFNVRVDSSGTIENGTFNGGAQNYDNGTISGGTFGGTTLFNYGIISDGAFNSETTYNFGEICNGTFGKAVESYDGTISGGTFADAVANYNAIKGGTFNGEVTNEGTIEGGIFALPVVNEGGTISTCAYPVHATLTGVSIAEAVETRLFATYEKDGAESNRFTLVADEGYTLPEAVVVRCGTADGAELVAGADYTYDAASGVVAIKQSAVAGPVFLVASGVPAEPTPPEPEDPESSEPATPTSSPTPQATTLASTGDSPLPLLAAGVVLAAGALAVLARKKLARR